MGWETIKWTCQHEGRMQMYGPHKSRDYKVAWQRERKCMVCWLIDQWRDDDGAKYASARMVTTALDICGRKSIEIEHPQGEDEKNRHFLGSDYDRWTQAVKDKEVERVKADQQVEANAVPCYVNLRSVNSAEPSEFSKHLYAPTDGPWTDD